MVKKAPETTTPLTAGGFHTQNFLTPTDTPSRAAAFVPFLSHFSTGGCRWRAGRVNCWFYSSLQQNQTSNKSLHWKQTGRTPTATFPKNPTISNHWEIRQGRWGQNAWQVQFLFGNCQVAPNIAPEN